MLVIPEWLPKRAERRIRSAAESIQEVFSDRLDGILLVGDLATPVSATTSAKRGTCEIVAAVSEVSAEDLHRLAEQAHEPMQWGVRIRVLTTEELQGSCDVFALQIAEWKDAHAVLLGHDAFEGLKFSRTNLRRSLEIALRTCIRDLRDRMLLGLVSRSSRKREDFISLSLNRVAQLSRHILWLVDGVFPETPSEQVRLLAKKLDYENESLGEVLERVQAGRVIHDPLEVLASLLPLVQQATAYVDHMDTDNLASASTFKEGSE